MSTQRSGISTAAGFSLVELMIAMTVTLIVMGISSNMIAQSFKMRTRENQRMNALTDAQRALNIMTREIANSGFGLVSNGITAANSDNTRIRFRADLNNDDRVNDDGEDVFYMRNVSNGRSSLIRVDVNAGPSVVAERIDALTIRYYNGRVNYTATAPPSCDINDGAATEVAPNQARYVVLAVCVTLDAVGAPGSPGYQPPSTVQLVSDVVIRNSNLQIY
jgi:prepilin-type N-terminal cleavage/methylation domain-containing protein